jgi:hypothetical protein
LNTIHDNINFALKTSQPLPVPNFHKLLAFSLNWLLAIQSTTLTQSPVRVGPTSATVLSVPLIVLSSA